MRILPVLLVVWLGLALAAQSSFAQEKKTRDQLVHEDRANVEGKDVWIYNDPEAAYKAARKQNKPLFFVFRCIPCEQCSKFDKDLLEQDNPVRDLFERFICVRVIQCNHLDLSQFQFDFDQSFHAMFLSADKTVYARYGTRSIRKEEEDMTLDGLRETMLAVLDLHADREGAAAALAGKQPVQAIAPYPEELPFLKGRYAETLDYEGKVASSCIHCHQVIEAQRRYFRDDSKPIPHQLLFPFPLPDVIGLRLDPKTKSTIDKVLPESPAHRAGFQSGDEILEFGGHLILSAADLQWRLHLAKDIEAIPVKVSRAGEPVTIEIALGAGWRRAALRTWSASGWDLRRMVTGGLKLEKLSHDKRREMKLDQTSMALFVQHAGRFGEHAAAYRAGVRNGDVIVAFDGKRDNWDEADLILHALEKPKGAYVKLTYRRDGKDAEVAIPMQ